MKKLIIAIPHSHTWFWTQTCIASLVRNPPKAEGYTVQVIIVNNSQWSPAIRGVTDTVLTEGLNNIGVMDNYKSNKFHASALDCVIDTSMWKNSVNSLIDFDLLMAWETDVLALRPDWLQWFVDQMRPTDYAVGAWHHEQFVNPSCTLYRGSVLREMLQWCKSDLPPNELRWGPNFEKSAPLDDNLLKAKNQDMSEIIKNAKDWIAAPFCEKRGWREGTVLKEQPSGQPKGPGHYEPGQALHHWAVQAGYTYTTCPTITTKRSDGVPLQTIYGATFSDPKRQLESGELFDVAETVHMWAGTRALDILKHDVDDQGIKDNTPFWLQREARFWNNIVPLDVRQQTLDLIRKYGWHYRGQGTPNVTDRDRAAVEYVRQYYKNGGVEW
jgi:hypothetical protein